MHTDVAAPGILSFLPSQALVESGLLKPTDHGPPLQAWAGRLRRGRGGRRRRGAVLPSA